MRILSPERIELVAAYSLGAVGAAQGAFRYYIAPELTLPRVAGLIALPVAVLAVRAAVSNHSPQRNAS